MADTRSKKMLGIGGGNRFKCAMSDLVLVSSNNDGGPGSGNFGHAGVPGQVGGSAPSGGVISSSNKENFGSPGVYEVYRNGDVKSSKLGYVCFALNKGYTGLYAESHQGQASGKYHVTLNNPIVGRGEDEQKALADAYKKLTGKEIPKSALTDTDELRKYNEEFVAAAKAAGHDSYAFDIQTTNFFSGEVDDHRTEVAVFNDNLDQVARQDGGPGSGNFGHEGRPGEIGGSSPSGQSLSEPVSKAWDSDDPGEVRSAMKSSLSKMAVGQAFEFYGSTTTKASDNRFVCEGPFGDASELGLDEVADTVTSIYGDAECDPPEFKDVETAPSNSEATLSDSAILEKIGEAQDSDIAKNPWKYGLNGTVSNAMAATEDLNKPPTVMSDEEFRKYVSDNGCTVIYRGVSEGIDENSGEVMTSLSDMRKNFAEADSSEACYGGGNYGSGYHFSTDKDYAKGFGQSKEDDGDILHGETYQCALKPDAKIVDYSTVKAESDRLGVEPTAWALANGYDAVYGDDSGHVYNIINRSALVMNKSTINGDSRDDGGPGSGNHGHKGVPGQVGGSAPSDGILPSSGFEEGNYGKIPIPPDRYDVIVNNFEHLWNSPPTDEQAIALNEYGQHTYSSINPQLRDGTQPEDCEASDTIRNIDEYLSACNIPFGMTVFRSSGAELLGGNSTADEINENVVGSVVQERAYTSTSLNPGKTGDFGNIEYEIKVPTGKGIGAYVANHTGHEGEYEFLLARNTYYKVTGASEVNGKTKVQMEIVFPKGNSDSRADGRPTLPRTRKCLMSVKMFSDKLAEISANSAHFRSKSLDLGRLCDTIKSQEHHLDGGPGSGNFGHEGVPGQVGGSAPKGGAGSGSGSKTKKPASHPPSGGAAAKDCKLSSKRSAGAQKAYDTARSNEPAITDDMYEITSSLGNTLDGLDFSVKTASSLEDKIERKLDAAKKSRKPISDEEIVSQMGDLVRYTQISEHDKIAETTQKTISSLEKKGYEILEVDNKYLNPDSDYKGVHINAKAKNGQKFELQIHSKESMKVKNALHPLYEEARKVGTSPERRAELQQEMKRISSELPTPKGIDQVKNYKKV